MNGIVWLISETTKLTELNIAVRVAIRMLLFYYFSEAKIKSVNTRVSDLLIVKGNSTANYYMKRSLLLLFTSLLWIAYSFGQNTTTDNVIYIVDSIPVIEDPDEENQILPGDIADMTIVKNKDSLKVLGYEKFDGAIYVFTKEYRSRSAELKAIPSTRQMERKDGVWHFRNVVYNGKFIDYYYSGKKEGEGVLKNGTIEGLRTRYHRNGNISSERNYIAGIANGLGKEYYEDGSLKQKGYFNAGKEDRVWEVFFPNGQVKQRSNFKDGEMNGETTVYYSTGKILAVELVKNGKATPDKNLEKINQAMQRGHASVEQSDYKTALKHYSKAIEIDSTYAEAYFSRGTVKLKDRQFDDAVSDFDRALNFEPFMVFALSNRAFTRIRKHQFGNGRTLFQNREVTLFASKDKVSIPAQDLDKICADLRKAIFLGDKTKMVLEAFGEFCK
jgi:Tfp pilus assembly protein PilF